ncbi:hypothetical protein NXV79_11540 [Bacteroides thetaiotaomicron]|jgi:hypothetical protein|uniref:hypothetical protein n=1 Tax=Bacteroides thetaiotaomicron TaxID=818 RepID=UPI001C02C584|nr:hypothetical protein [Bacteroides thetaiotaomicron]MBT9886098.1 hypothetical protein [Bacteroides thetaiotaomicron]MCA5976782.1 hypothetical protein [Bacteroides thetaiotaomicron]MCE9204776.1 hypothetical protein [Bacteroides thetaiotaomicron]MCS3041954.1 hypothetical protein [Bacteroides thetaiotaomicron]UVP58712.1 hypothetical protein NXV79_11540 [Bacteroides thetaiotaomicron]
MYASLEDEIRDALYVAIRQNEEISRIGRETAMKSLRVAQMREEGSKRLASALDRFEAICCELGDIPQQTMMKVVRCSGRPKRPKFDLRTLNGHLVR